MADPQLGGVARCGYEGIGEGRDVHQRGGRAGQSGAGESFPRCAELRGELRASGRLRGEAPPRGDGRGAAPPQGDRERPNFSRAAGARGRGRRVLTPRGHRGTWLADPRRQRRRTTKPGAGGSTARASDETKGKHDHLKTTKSRKSSAGEEQRQASRTQAGATTADAKGRGGQATRRSGRRAGREEATAKRATTPRTRSTGATAKPWRARRASTWCRASAARPGSQKPRGLMSPALRGYRKTGSGANLHLPCLPVQPSSQPECRRRESNPTRRV